jgi:penicillin-binding protein 1C
MNKRLRLLRRAILALALPTGLWFAAAALLPFPEHKLQNAPQNLRLLDADGQPLRRVLSREGLDSDWIPLAECGEWTPRALVAVEDQRFFRHHGVDPVALLRATGQNLLSARVVSGASTLSTQVIRLIEPRPRTLATKGIEAFRATQLELRHDKAFILEQYLNRAPFGGNRQGLASAARGYFGKEAAQLSAGEAALLAGLPQSPSRFRPDLSPERAERRRLTVLRRMEEEGFLDTEPLLDSGKRFVPPPFRAPHFCDWVLARHPGLSGDQPTTLDPAVQLELEAAAAQFRADPRHERIDGIGLLVLDARSGAVLGMVGGFDPNDPRHGHVNNVLRRRAPGSTLKPFLFAMAMQQGWLRPDSLLDDRPRAYRDYQPRNMDHLSNGDVSATDALVRSLNLPALAVAERLGPGPALDRLRACGLSLPNVDAASVGLGFALGGGLDVSLLELCSAYTLFANGGARVEARAFPGERDAPQPVFAPGVAYWISRMLSGSSRDAALFGHVADVERPRLAFKTGTSHGLRDAWAIGWNGQRVIGVWLGRMDGGTVEDFSGSQHAAPLLGRLASKLLKSGDPLWPQPGDDVVHWQGREVLRGISDPENDAPAPASTARIVSPIPDLDYRSLEGAEAWIPLSAQGGGAGNIHWFINGTWAFEAPAGREQAWRFPEGSHQIRAVFPDGRSQTRHIRIRGTPSS